MTKKLRERWKQESHQMILDTPADDTKKSADFMIYKTDEDQRLVFGWASVAITVDGKELEDMQHDMIDPEDLEEAAYEYVLNFRDTGEEHLPGYRKKGRLVESCVFTPEKQKAMGIPEGTLPVAWWIGFKIDDNDTWQRVKNGTYRMFSIEGKAEREEVQKAAYDEWLEENMDKFSSEEEEIKFREWKSPGGFRARTASDVDEIDMQWDEYKRTVLEKTQKARTFDEILKFNPYHGVGGRFASANTATSMTVFTNSPAGQKAIANIRDREMAAMAAAENKKKQEQEDIGNTKKQKKHKDETKYGDVDMEGVNEQTYQQVAKDLGVNEKDAIRMVDAVNNYSDGAYKDIRAASRGEDSSYKDEANECEKFINASPKWAGGQLSRGLKVYDEEKFNNMISNVSEGKPIDMRGISSWSSDPGIAADFSGGDYPVILRTNKKSTNRGTSIRHLSEYRDEDEVLVSSKAKFMPTKMEMKDGTVIIYGDIK